MLKLIEVPAENVIFEVMARMILSVTNDLVTDQRVHRAAATLTSKGAKVTLAGRMLKNSLPVQRDYETHRMRLLFSKGPLFYAEFNIRLFLFLFFSKVDVLVANDLDTLPANYLVSVLRKKPLVYDTHEYFCGVPELQNRIFVKNIWRKIESTIFPKLTNIYTVNASIARLYEEEYGKNINVIRNVPVRIRKAGWPDRFALGLPRDKKIILLQGSGINMNRGAEEVLLALPHMENVVFLIVGGGDVIHLLKKMVVDEKLDQQVIFKPKMPYEEMMCYTRLADLGLSLDKDTNINYRYSLPNKVFDYIQAQIPVLCTNLVEVAAIVNTWQIGRVIDHLEPEYLAKTINEILADEHQVAVWKHNLENAANVLCWENEEHELIRIYSKFL